MKQSIAVGITLAVLAASPATAQQIESTPVDRRLPKWGSSGTSPVPS